MIKSKSAIFLLLVCATAAQANISNFADEAVANLTGRLKLLDIKDNYYGSKASAWLDAARTELSQTAIRETNAQLVNDLAYNAEQIIMAIEAGQTGYRQIALPTVESKHASIARAKELLKLYQYKNCLTPLRGHFEVELVYAQTGPNAEIAYARLAEVNKRVIADQRNNCAEFTPIMPSGVGITTTVTNSKTLNTPTQVQKPLAAILAESVPEELNVFINGDIAALPLVVDDKKEWYEAINEALIPKGLEMKFDVSKRALHLGPFMRTQKNNVSPAAFSVNTLLAHWASKAGLSITTEGALVDYALTPEAKAADYADDLRIAVQQLTNFYKNAGIPIVAEVKENTLHITNQPKTPKELK